jgi:hypothetical protein
MAICYSSPNSAKFWQSETAMRRISFNVRGLSHVLKANNITDGLYGPCTFQSNVGITDCVHIRLRRLC